MKTLIAPTEPPRLITAAMFAALALSCSAVSIAGNDGDVGDVPQAVVKFGDLNLTSPQGAAALYDRIVAAAYQVCESFDVDMRGLVAGWQLLACVHSAIAHAVTKVGQPELFAIYNARNHEHLPITVAAAQAR